LTDEQWAMVRRVCPDGDLDEYDALVVLDQIRKRSEQENIRELVADLRASAVSTAAVDQLREEALDFDGLLAQPEQSPLIEGVLTEGATAALLGATNIGKSFLALAWCLCVATGQAVAGTAGAAAAGPLRRRGGHRRPAQTRGGLGEQTGVVPGAEDFALLSVPGRLDDPRTMRTLSRMAAEDGRGLVVFDTLSSLAPEAEKPGEAPRWLAELKALREGQPGRGTALYAHHTALADPTRARNSGALEANPDEVLVLTQASPTSGLLTLTGKKVKDGPNGWTIPQRRTLLGPSCIIERLPGGKPPTGVVGAPQDGAKMQALVDHPVFAEAASWSQRIRNHLAAVADDGATAAELKAALGVPETKFSSFYKALKALREDGEAIKIGQRYFLSKHVPAKAA
jgi:hypothetical protein